MVHLILSSTKGNQGGKYFPFLGFLGLTPVRVEGIVRTKLDTDLKLLPSTSLTISVRCYEHRVGRVNVTNSRILVDHTQVLWLKPDDVEYEPIGVSEYPFRIILPATVAGFSTATFVDYRCTWRVEAVLNHVPITGVGSRQIRHFELPLTRFDLPKHALMPSPAKSPVTLDQCTSKPRAPRIRYSYDPPSHPVGPSETLSIPLHLQPLESNVSIKNATVLVERRIQLLEPQSTAASSPIPIPNPPFHHSSTSHSARSSPSASPHSSSAPLSSSHSSYFSSSRDSPPSSPSEQASPSQHFEPAQSTASLVSSQPTITPNNVNPSTASLFSWTSDSPLLHTSFPAQQQPPQTPPMTTSSPTISSSSSASKIVVNPIVGTETDSFTRDPKGLWSSTISFEWPASKSHSRWAVGETISSDLVSVKYFVRVKISVTSPANGTDTIELGEKELLIVSTSEQERHNAQQTYAELVESGRVNDSALRSKSKSPRRLKPIERGDIPPSPAPYRGEVASTSSHQASSSRTKAPRRPHTSAGPRDRSSFRQANGDPHKKRRSEVGWGAMGLPIAVGMTEPGVSSQPATHHTTKNGSVATSSGDISKKGRSSSSGKLSSSSFWAVSAPPLKNQSSSSSSGGKARSAGALGTSSGTSTTASTSSVSSGRSGRRGKGDSSCDEDDEEWRPHTALSSRSGIQKPDLKPSRPPPSSFNPAIVSQAEGGHGHHAASVREWEEELSRIEEKSRKESNASGFGRLRKRSFVSTMKDLLPSRKVFNLGGGDDSSS